MALNAALVGMKSASGGMAPNPDMPTSFETLALPVANRKGMGVIAMKVFAQEYLSKEAPAEKLIQYSLSLPVSLCVVGMPKPELIDENVRIVKAFRSMPEEERKKFAASLAMHHKARIDRFFANHIDG